MRLKKHACPNCAAQLKVVKMKKTVKANTEEAAGFKFTAAGHPLGEKVKFIWYEFKCTGCGNMTTEADMKAYEKRIREEEKAARKAAKKEEKAAKRAK